MQHHATLSRLIRDSTAAGRALLTGANASAQRSALGLGSAALRNESFFAIAHADGYLPMSGGTLTGALSTSGRLNSTVSENSGNIVGRLSLGSGNTGIWNTGGNGLVLSPAGLQSFLVASYSIRGWAAATIDWASINDNGTQLSTATVDLSLGRAAANHLRQRNGINGQTFDLTGTWTSVSQWESLCLKATASAHQIGSARGSAGGNNWPVQLGHFNSAGAFTAGLSVATSGAVTCNSYRDNNDGTGSHFLTSISRDLNGNYFSLSAAAFTLSSGTDIRFTNSISVLNSGDVRISRNSAGVLQIGTTAANALGSLLLTNLTASGNLHFPSLPTSDPGVVGRLWRDGTTLKISV